MNLVGYTATALSRNDIEDTPTNKNVVDGAIVELKTLSGDLVVIYDDENGTNPETQKACDSDGQCEFYAEAGDYNLEVNGKVNKISLFFNKDKVNDIAAWGDRFVGYFVDGFTYTKADDVAKGIDGKYYSYGGAGAYPVVIAAGTVPSEPEHTPAVLSDAESVKNTDGSSSQDAYDATKALLIAQGLSGNYGFFEKGFTYNEVGDVGIDVDGSIYVYTGVSPLPVTVAAGTVPSEPDYKLVVLASENRITPEYFGVNASSTPAERTSALIACINSGMKVFVTGGVYSPISLTVDNLDIKFSNDSLFKLTDNATNSSTNIPKTTFLVAGNNITSAGTINVDGNLSNNPSNSMNTSALIGAVHVTGHNFSFDKIKVKNASWVGYSEGDELNVDVNSTGRCIYIENPRHYATSIWSKVRGRIDNIKVLSGVDSLDARVRFGSQSSSTTKPELTSVGNINTNDSVVFESNCHGISFDSIIAEACKLENVRGVSGSTVYVRGTEGAAFGFAMLSNCEDSNIGSVVVESYQGTTGKAVVFDLVKNCSVGALLVKGTTGNNADVEIRDADGLDIGLVTCKDPAGVGAGFRFDYDAGYANQKNITIGRINSTGHTGLDVEVQSPQLADVNIGSINSDATTNVEYLKTKNFYSKGDTIANLTPSGGSITLNSSQNTLSYIRNGDNCLVTGRLKVSAVNAPTGGLTIGPLPYVVADLGGLGGFTTMSIRVTSLAQDYTGVISGQVAENGSYIDVVIDNGTNILPDPAPIIGVDSVVLISLNYIAG